MAAQSKSRTSEQEWVLMLAISTAMLAASYFHWWSISFTEALGFATNGVCVWLNVRENIWNWPIGLAGNVCFFILFREARLFSDMWLQVVFFGFGVYGWYEWLRGGTNHSTLHISRTRGWEWGAVVLFVGLGTYGMREALLVFNGAAPFWDAFTTGLSLAAQYLICRKRLENWFVWIIADLIYVPLYFYRALPLTAILYGIFFVMCLLGFLEWRKTWRQERAQQP